MSTFAEIAAVAAPAVQDPGSTAVDGAEKVGRIFESGGIDGLVLYALILAVFLQFLGLVLLIVINSRERGKAADGCAQNATEFANASNEASDALRDVATALAASASADMTFKQSQANLMDRLERVLIRLEERGKI